MNADDLILKTVAKLGGECRAADLVVHAHLNNPGAFCLEGWPTHPDSNKVLSRLMGKSKGLVARGLLEKIATKTYKITAAGQARIRTGPPKRKVPPPKPLQIVALAPELEEILLRMLSSLAWAKHREGRVDQIFTEALSFWGVVGTNPDKAVEATWEALSAISPVVENRRIVLMNGREVSKVDVESLINLHKFFTQRFQRHLTVLRMKQQPKEAS